MLRSSPPAFARTDLVVQKQRISLYARDAARRIAARLAAQEDPACAAILVDDPGRAGEGRSDLQRRAHRRSVAGDVIAMELRKEAGSRAGGSGRIPSKQREKRRAGLQRIILRPPPPVRWPGGLSDVPRTRSQPNVSPRAVADTAAARGEM